MLPIFRAKGSASADVFCLLLQPAEAVSVGPGRPTKHQYMRRLCCIDVMSWPCGHARARVEGAGAQAQWSALHHHSWSLQKGASPA